MLLCLTGLPGAGKSTWTKQFCSQLDLIDPAKFYRVSSDDLRLMIYNVHHIISLVEFDLLDVCVCELLKQQKNVVIDATNLKRKHRTKWASIARIEGHKYEVKYFRVPLDECLIRNKTRLGQSNHVPHKKIVEMADSFEIPTVSEGHTLTIIDK